MRQRHALRLNRCDCLRAVAPSLLSILLFGLAIWIFFLPSFNVRIIGDKREMLARVTQLVWGVLNGLDQQVQTHQMTRKEAEASAIREIGNMRYGSNLRDHFWISDMQGNIIVCPQHPESGEKEIISRTATNGEPSVGELIKAAEQEGHGYVSYMSQGQDSAEKSVPKLRYIRVFEPWGWVVGTEIPMDGVASEMRKMTKKVTTFSLAILVLIGLILFYSVRQTLALEKERNDAETALLKSEARFKKLVENVPFGVSIMGPNGAVEYINPEFTRIFGFTREDVSEKGSWFLKAYPDARYRQQVTDVWRNDVAVLETNGGIVERIFKVRCGNGQEKTIRFRNVAIESRRQSLIYEDISEQAEAERKLQESERRYRRLYEKSKTGQKVYSSLLKSSADAIIIYDLDGNAQYVSPAFTAIFGWSKKEVLHRKVPFLPDSEKESTYSVIEALVRDGTPCQGFESRRLKKDGEIVDVSISASRYDDLNGNPSGILVIIRDISEKKKLQIQLQQAQKMEAIGTLAGGIAHDFNNLLMGIQGNASLMLMQIDKHDRFYDKLKNIEDQVQSGSKLTRQLLGYARQGRYEIKPINLNEVVGEIAETFGRTKKEISLHLKLGENLLGIEADRTQIEQVFLNLCVNAWQAMPGGGELFIETRNTHHERMQGKVYSVKPGTYVLLTVRDTGIGMDPGTLERIFEPFFTTKEMGHGTGLGLASVYGIVKGHGGYIDVESKAGEGSTFKIYFPASSRSMATQKDVVENVGQGSGTILLVEDEDAVANVAHELLETLGYKTLVARDGKSAIATYKEMREEIDLVLLDMVMPGMSGGEVFNRLKEINSDVRVLLSSGYSLTGEAQAILDRGCHGFIQKPYRISTLTKAISGILSGPTWG